MELIVHPVSVFVFDEDTESTNSRRYDFLTLNATSYAILRGVFLTGLCLLVFFFAPGSPELRRTLSVLLLVTGNTGLLIAEKGGLIKILLALTTFKRTWFSVALLLLLALTLAYIPFMTSLFQLAQPSLIDFSMIVILGFTAGFIVPYRRLFLDDRRQTDSPRP